ncbi:LysR family transcriptional regulator [Nocardiopsis ganjiahuensis]|uniref:LysR family transcriptional regulator n=1 Tax=Nocardiopsis ganjiahuensis TaxID=239984 RepID=UPI00034760D2|nr:LysR family transcriptional regulator [Nocardiopsis ganjiahuensis]
MDTRLLGTFLTVARTGNFTVAAADLHLSQSTVTAQIKALEKELGCRLFDRLPRGARLTETGRRIAAEAAGVLEAEARLHAAVGDGTHPVGRVAVGVGDTLCSGPVPRVIAELSRTRPGIEVDLVPLGTDAALDGLRRGRLDLALLLEDEDRFPDMVTEKLSEEPLVLLGAPDHPLVTAETPVGWEELAREPFFLHEEGCSFSDRVARELRGPSGVRPRLTRLGSSEAARACVMAGLGLAALPLTAARDALSAGALATVAGPPVPNVPVRLVHHRSRWISPAARAVVDAFTEYFAAAPKHSAGDR